jgi:hypothetical protein
VLTTSAGAEAVEEVVINAEGAVGLTDITLPPVAEVLVEDVSLAVLDAEEDPELTEDEVDVLAEEPPITVTSLSPVPLVEKLPLPAVVAVPDPLADDVAALPDELPLSAVVAPDPLVEGDVLLLEEPSLSVAPVVLDEEPPITVTEDELSDCP